MINQIKLEPNAVQPHLTTIISCKKKKSNNQYTKKSTSYDDRLVNWEGNYVS